MAAPAVSPLNNQNLVSHIEVKCGEVVAESRPQHLTEVLTHGREVVGDVDQFKEFLICLPVFIFLFSSLHSFNLSPCRNCELMSARPPGPSHLHHFPTTGSTSSLGLLQLLQERSISACPHPHSRAAPPSWAALKNQPAGSPSDTNGKRNVFSLNLVEKLQSLGLHRVAAWGMKRDRVQQHPSKV